MVLLNRAAIGVETADEAVVRARGEAGAWVGGVQSFERGVERALAVFDEHAAAVNAKSDEAGMGVEERGYGAEAELRLLLGLHRRMQAAMAVADREGYRKAAAEFVLGLVDLAGTLGIGRWDDARRTPW